MGYRLFRLFVVSILSFIWQSAIAQSFSGCFPTTPTFNVDLRNNPDSLWISPRVVRRGLCCGYDPAANPPIRCVQFRLTLDDDAVGIIFNIASGAVPPGALGYSIDCGPLKFPGEVVCLSGPWPKYLTFCKPGANPNTYSILSIGKPKISPPITVSDGCTGVIGVTGLDINTIKWTSVPNNPVHNSYLNCIEKCSTVVATYQPGAPDSVVYEASGQIIGNCSTVPFRATTKVYFINNKKVEILPKDPVVCFGSSGAVVTAFPSGGRPPYQYLWNTGQTTKSIQVGEGTYSVQVTDASSCPGTADTVVVTSFKLPIVAKAGPDVDICRYNNTVAPIQLQGSVQAVKGGRWSGGRGSFVPNDSTLNAIYRPSLQEIISGSVTLSLTTIGNADCPPNSDAVTINFRDPIRVAVSDKTICIGSSTTVLAPFISGLGYGWTLNGTNVSNSNSYTFSPAKSTSLVLTTTNQYGCIAKDTVTIFVQPKPVVALPDQKVCVGKSVSLNATPSNSLLGPITYSWLRNGQNLGSGSASITTVLPGTYIVFVSAGACTVSDTAIVSNYVIDVKANAPSFYCRNAKTGINLNATKTNTPKSRWFGSGTFSPNDTASSVFYFPTATELTKSAIIVVLKSEGNTGCVEDVDSVKINISPSPILMAPSISVCIGDIATITSNLPDSLSPKWYTQKNVFLANGNSFTSKFDSTTFLILKAQSATGCKDSAIATIKAYNKPLIDIRDTIICNGGTSILDARLLNVFQGIGAYSWYKNSVPLAETTQRLTVKTSGKYTVEFGLAGCKAKDSSIVDVFNMQVQASDDQYLCKNELTAGVSLSTVASNSAKVKWIGNGGVFTPNDSAKIVTYFPTLSEGAGTESKILLQTTGNGVCKEAKDSVMIFFKPYILATGTSETVCEGENSILSSPLIAGMQYVWKNIQGSVIGNSNQIIVNVKSDTSFQVKVTNVNGCSDSTKVNVETFPKPIIKIDGATTCTGDSLILKGTPLNRSETFVQPIFDWYKDGNLLSRHDSILKVGVSGIYTLRYGKGVCVGTDTAKMVFTLPTIDLNPVAPLCIESGKSVPLVAISTHSDSVVWLTSGTGVFELLPLKGNANYLPSNADFTSSKIKIMAETFRKNLRCVNVKDSTEIAILPSPIAKGIGDTVCVGVSAVLQATIPNNWNAEWYAANGALLSSKKNLNVTNSSDQVYSLVVTDQNACKDTASIPLLTFAKPIVVLKDTTSCLGDTLDMVPILTASSIVVRKYAWYKNGLLLPEKGELLKVSESGNYSIVFGENGCVGSDDAFVVIEEPKLSVVQPTPICRNYAGRINLQANVNVNRKIRWIGEGVFVPSDSVLNPSYKPSASELASDSFRINVETIQNAKCTGVSDKVIVDILNAPIPKALSDTVCVGDTVRLNALANSSETISWIENGIVKSSKVMYKLAAFASGNVLLKITNSNGCADSINVPYGTFSKPLLQLTDVMTCQGDKPVLNGMPSNFNPSNAAYAWFKNNVLLTSNTSSLIVADSGMYKLKFGIGNCTAFDSAKVSFFRPSLSVTGDNDICRNQKEINLNAIYTNADGLEWSTKSGVLPVMYQTNSVTYPYLTNDIIDDKSILVFVKLKQNNPPCFSLSDTIEVMLKESPFLQTNGDTVCKSSTAVVSVEQELGTSYVWRDSFANSLSNTNRYVFSPTKSERLYLYAQNSNGCKDSVNVDVKLIPPANVRIQNTPACIGQLLTLKMVTNDSVSGVKNIKWFNKGLKIAENINPIQYSESGNYTVIYSNIYCKDTASTNIVFNPAPLVEKDPPLLFCPESNTQIQLDAGQYAKYVWQNDTSAKARFYQATKEGDYKVLVFNQYGCSAEKTLTVKELCKPRLFVPNAFTPSGSNNNLFKVQYANVKNYQMLIFNRWGEIIFESLDPAISWDGIYRGEPMPVGVYAWVVTYEGIQEQYKGPYKAQGSVTLIR